MYLDVPDMRKTNAVQLTEMTDDGGDIILPVRSERTAANRECVARAVDELHDTIQIPGVGHDTWQTEY